MDKSPAFQFYPKDWLTDPDVVCMNFAQKGAYITLLCYCWLEGQLPKNDDYINQDDVLNTWEVKNTILYNNFS